MTCTKEYFKVAVRKFDPFETALKKCWDSFCASSGCNMELKAVPMDLPLLHKTTIEDGGLKNGQWDIAHLSADWVAEAYNNQDIENLTPFIQQLDTPNFLNSWTSSLLKSQQLNNGLYGLPFHDGPECLIYRKDLFEDPNTRAKFLQLYKIKLNPPSDWESFEKIATFFNQPDKGFYGTAVAAFADGHNAVYDFCMQVWTRGGDFILKDGTINMQTKEVVEGLRYYRYLVQNQQAVHPKSSHFDSVQLGTAFIKGEIAMMINWFGFAALAQVTPNSKVKGRVDIAPIPHSVGQSSVSPNSYWIYSIGKGSQNKALAFDFIQFATNAINDQQLTLEGGIGCRKSTWEDALINDKIPFFHQLDSLHKNARALPSIPEWPKLAVVIDRIMSRVTQSAVSIETILAEEQHYIHQNILHNAY